MEFAQYVQFRGKGDRVMSYVVEFRCKDPLSQCKAGVDAQGVVDLEFIIRFNRTYIEGPCLDLEHVLKSACGVLAM